MTIRDLRASVTRRFGRESLIWRPPILRVVMIGAMVALHATLLAGSSLAAGPAPLPTPRTSDDSSSSPVPLVSPRPASNADTESAPIPAPTSPRAAPAATDFALGVDPQNPGDATEAATVIARYIAQAGRAPALVSYYMSWSDARDFDSALADTIYAAGAIPFITWSSHDWTAGVTQAAWSNQRVAGGAYDGYIARWGQQIAAYGRVIYVRLDHEMNGDWYSWSPGVNGNTIASYVAMWRHVVDVMRQQGATNVRWVWCPNVGANDFRPMYPGDGYVDWVGLDGYNYGPGNGAPWRSFTQIFAVAYATLQTLTPSKPIVVAETGSVEQGGSKAAWLMSAFQNEIPASFPRIRAVIYFDEDKTVEEGVNWLLTSSATALEAWRQIVGDARWQGKLAIPSAAPPHR